MNLQDKIFSELRRLHFSAGHLWRFPQYLNSFLIDLNPIERKEFPAVMEKLCEEGFFTNEDSNYRLTEKGEATLWKDDK